MAKNKDEKKQKLNMPKNVKTSLSTNTSKPNPFLAGNANQDKPSPKPKPEKKPPKSSR